MAMVISVDNKPGYFFFQLVPVMISAEAGEARLETAGFGIWRFKGDKIAEQWEMNFDQYGFDAFIAAAEGVQK